MILTGGIDSRAGSLMWHAVEWTTEAEMSEEQVFNANIIYPVNEWLPVMYPQRSIPVQ
jgi:hypothetical protein